MGGLTKKLQKVKQYSSYTLFIGDATMAEVARVAAAARLTRAKIIKKFIAYCLSDEKITAQAVDFNIDKK